MNNILLFLDTETTGLSLAKSEVVQIAVVAQYNGEWAGTINLSCQPFSYANVSLKALEVCDLPIEKLKTFDMPDKVFMKFVSGLTKIRNRISPTAKFTAIAHNAAFDKKFLAKWWKNCSDACDVKIPPIKRFLNEDWIDSLVLARELVEKKVITSKNARLETLAEHYSVKFEGRGAHDALSDTQVLKEVFYHMANDCRGAIDSGQKMNSKAILEAVGV